MNQSLGYHAGCTYWSSTATAYIASKPAGQDLYCNTSQSAGTSRCISDYTSQGVCFAHPLTDGTLVPAAYNTGSCSDPANDQGELGQTKK
jgi:hypothetical protein